jgi:hypothetical protein
MLGWEVLVYRHGRAEPENLLAQWDNGSSVVDWMERLARSGLAKDCGGTGYPWIFTVKAEIFTPALKSTKYDEHVQRSLSCDLLPPLGISSEVRLKEQVLDDCSGDEELLIYAWDKS